MPLTQQSEMATAFMAPFAITEVKWKPQAVKNNKALALAYIDARAIQDRLDDVAGVDGWCDEYELLPDGSALCRLKVKMNGEWITKMDVGSPSEQPDAGDRVKAAFSDSLKRAAVKFGIGRYLYRLPSQWCDYDPVKRQFIKTPGLPDFARGGVRSNPPQAPAQKQLPAAPPQQPPKPPPAPKANTAPANGAELLSRMKTFEATMVAKKYCQEGDLMRYVGNQGVAGGYGENVETWTGAAITFAVEVIRQWATIVTPMPNPTSGQTLTEWVRWRDCVLEYMDLISGGRLITWLSGVLQKESLPPMESVNDQPTIDWAVQSVKNYEQGVWDKKNAKAS